MTTSALAGKRQFASGRTAPTAARAISAAMACLVAVWTADGSTWGQGPAAAPGIFVSPPPAAYPFAPPPLFPPRPTSGAPEVLVASAQAAAPVDTSESAAANLSKRLAEVEEFVKSEKDKRKAEEQKKQQVETEGYEVGSDLNFKTFWRDGLNAETANKDFRVHFGGRVHVDAGWFAPDSNLESLPGPQGWQDGADFRRLRLRGGGTMYEVFIWVLEFDLSNAVAGTTNHPVPTDAFLGITHLPYVGNLEIGHFKEPYDFDDYGTQDNYLVFMERSLCNNAFGRSRNIGMMFYDSWFDQTLLWASGVFRSNSDNASGNAYDYGDGEYAWTSRVCLLPYYENEGRCWFLFGGAYSHVAFDPDDPGIGGANPSRARLSSRMPIRVNSPLLVDTTNLVADDEQLFNVQLAMSLGPLYIQSEYYHADVEGIRRGFQAPGVPRLRNAGFDGFYAQASYFLTDEYHPIDRNRGRLERVRPNENFFLVSRGEGEGTAYGHGAWEVALRYDYLDLRSSALDAFPGVPGVPGSAAPAITTDGIEQAITAGVNWYLCPNARIMWNYAHAWRNVGSSTGNGQVDGLAMRMLFDF